jgi:proteasome accessory factor A
MQDKTTPVVEAYLKNMSHLGQYLGNGARFYMDASNHREYATPPDNEIAGTVANEIAGERIMYDALSASTDSFGGAKSLGDFYLNKRVLAEDGKSWGYHENYLAPKEKVQICEESLTLLGLHAATRNILFGGGFLAENGDYYLSQKSHDIETDYNDSTTRDKPVINLRKEHLSDAEKWVRVHLTSGDPNMSPWATWVKIGSTSIVLRLMENDEQLGSVRFKDELSQIMRQVEHDYKAKNFFALENGDSVTAAGVQLFLIDAAKQLPDGALRREEEAILVEWERAALDYRQNWRLLRDRADWAARLIILEQGNIRRNWDWSDRRMHNLSRDYDDMAPGSLGNRLRQGVWAKWMPDEALIKERMADPPLTTRSKLIGEFIQTACRYGLGQTAKASWTTIEHGHKVDLKDPYDHQNPAAEKLISSIAERHADNKAAV